MSLDEKMPMADRITLGTAITYGATF